MPPKEAGKERSGLPFGAGAQATGVALAVDFDFLGHSVPPGMKAYVQGLMMLAAANTYQEYYDHDKDHCGNRDGQPLVDLLFVLSLDLAGLGQCFLALALKL